MSYTDTQTAGEGELNGFDFFQALSLIQANAAASSKEAEELSTRKRKGVGLGGTEHITAANGKTRK